MDIIPRPLGPNPCSIFFEKSAFRSYHQQIPTEQTNDQMWISNRIELIPTIETIHLKFFVRNSNCWKYVRSGGGHHANRAYRRSMIRAISSGTVQFWSRGELSFLERIWKFKEETSFYLEFMLTRQRSLTRQ